MRQIDEVNNISTEVDGREYIREYFEDLDIPAEEKKEREDLAYEIFELVMVFFTLIDKEHDLLDRVQLLLQFETRYAEIIEKYGGTDSYLSKYLDVVSNDIIETTLEHLGEPFYVSELRGAIISINEQNSIENYKKYIQAMLDGKTMKIWRIRRKPLSRETHLNMNGIKISIRDTFDFPDCSMIMPHDIVNGTAKQTCNCGCYLEFE